MDKTLFVLALFGFVAFLATLARRLALPYPIVVAVGGFLLGFVPGVPRADLNPDLVYLFFIPPVLYYSGAFTSLRDFRANLRPILLLVFGLIPLSVVVTAVVAHAVVAGLSWPAAFVLGTVLSPPEAVVATQIFQRLGVPRRIVVILQGESLVKSATMVVVYRVAVAAALTGEFHPADVVGRLVLASGGGALIGTAVSLVTTAVRRRIDDFPVEITISLLTPFAAYLAASAVGANGALAAVAAGLVIGPQLPHIMSPATRLQGFATWQAAIFLINGTAFVLIGLELQRYASAWPAAELWPLVGQAALLLLAIMAVRMAWVFAATYLPRRLSRSLRERDPDPPWQRVFVIGWTAMRGVVAAAAALAIPLVGADGTPFPSRDVMLFLAFTVIVLSLLVEGLPLPALVHRLGLTSDGETEREEHEARRTAARAAMKRVEELVAADGGIRAAATHLWLKYDNRLRRLRPDGGPPSSTGNGDGGATVPDDVYPRLRHEALRAERDAVIELRNRGVISDDVLHRIERELDLDESRL